MDSEANHNSYAVTIGLTNPKSPSNVGAVMRAAGCFGADAVFYTGKRYENAARFSTDTKNQINKIPLNAATCLLDNTPDKATVVCVELVEGATPLPEFDHPDNAFYIFGPEDGSLSQQVIDSADEVIFVPTTGCLNLAATVNIVLYDRRAKQTLPADTDALIRRSRDVNNRVKVRS